MLILTGRCRIYVSSGVITPVSECCDTDAVFSCELVSDVSNDEGSILHDVSVECWA